MPLWNVRYRGPRQVEFAVVETKSPDHKTAVAVAEMWLGTKGVGYRMIAVEPFVVATETILKNGDDPTANPSVPAPPPLPQSQHNGRK